ncbi:ribosomal protein S18 acetylase RimI-like enzyme [Tumebacillus sp. BK434]|uniref:GNAT family N-acetyltransferase n=1 Tax=Tumebacillus sp. BK434 TaxID=2512169 RepID=UPI0010509DB2|nr:GNAT family N-acetyltransferase [Tumebacillus sp. BK434]TCP55871.1 ribosomal protein S18 acetylase RimI-like enzyme [Tumebacillus sp. BK434]
MTIETRTQMTTADIEALTALAALVKAQDGLALKLNMDMLKNRSGEVTNDFLYYQDGKLIGFLGMYGFNTREIEINGMVHPDYRRQGVFTKLYAAAKSECTARGIASMLFIVEEEAAAGLAFAKQIGAAYEFTEYGMDLKDEGKAPTGGEVELVRASTAADAAFIGQLMATGFGLPAEDMKQNIARDFNNPNKQVYIGRIDGQPIAAISVGVGERDTAFFYGFVVEPEFRGKGYGRYILWTLVKQMQAEGRTRLALEVATENKSALGLYQSVGFKLMTAFGYYRLGL